MGDVFESHKDHDLRQLREQVRRLEEENRSLRSALDAYHRADAARMEREINAGYNGGFGGY